MDIENAKKQLLEYLNKTLLDVCYASECSVYDIKSKKKDRLTSDIRSVYMYIAKESFPYATLDEIGSVVNRDHSTVSYALKSIRECAERGKLYDKIQNLIRVSKHVTNA